jgi:predicted AlkP superfamily phosphohydrolase/phosphomutase
MKAMILGLDSADARLIERWIDLLPNLRSMREAGVHGVLKSIVPPASMPAWQCFATGKNPAKIGVFGFLSIGRDRKLKYGTTPPDIGCVWDTASKAGLKVGVFNIPGTFPPYPVNGFMVAGFPAPPGKIWAYPSSLMKKLDEAVGGYDVDVPLSKPSEMKGGEEAYLAQVQHLHNKTLESAKLLIQWYEPDLFVMTFQALDLVQHDFTRYLSLPDSTYHNVVRDWYVRLDEAVGQLAHLTDPSTTVLALSDHGSLPTSMSFHVNEFLKSRGYLTVKKAPRKYGSRQFYVSARKLVLKTLPSGLITHIYRITPDRVAHKLTVSAQFERMLTNLVDSIDWNRTRAFSTGGHQAAIYITYNGDERFDRSQEWADTVRDLEQQFSGLVHPKTGERIRPIFHLKNDTFKGPFQYEAPDLCVELFTGEEKVHMKINLDSGEVWSFAPHLSSAHTREGFWSIKGPGIRAGMRLDAGILDMAPTLAAVLRIQAEDDYDGIVLDSILTGKDTDKPSVPVPAVSNMDA